MGREARREVLREGGRCGGGNGARTGGDRGVWPPERRGDGGGRGRREEEGRGAGLDKKARRVEVRMREGRGVAALWKEGAPVNHSVMNHDVRG